MIEALLLQVTPPVPVNDWLIALIIAVTPVLVMILDWGLNAIDAAHLLPSWAKPILATALGAALTYLSGITTDNALVMTAIGLAAVGLRQVIVWLGRAANVRFFK
jgi:hypothetical protein